MSTNNEAITEEEIKPVFTKKNTVSWSAQDKIPSSHDTDYDKVVVQTEPILAKETTWTGKLVWNDVCAHVGDHHILKDMCGEAKAGEVLAMLGPSGAGKTTLMNILAGRTQTSGNLKVEGYFYCGAEEVQPSEYRSSVAYVTQDDHLFPTSTPRECVEFVSKLRLNCTSKEREEKVAGLIDSLGLTGCQHTVIGNAMLKGVSGGQRKRTAVAVELVTDAKIIFLDEPCSGLDSFAAANVIKNLKKLAKEKGCIVILTIHTPPSQIFLAFDKVIILGKGNTVYQGKPECMADFMARAGYPVPASYNPAEWIISLTEGVAVEEGSENMGKSDAKKQERERTAVIEGLNKAYYQSLTYKRNKSFLQVHQGETMETILRTREQVHNGPLTQIKVLVIRECQKLARDGITIPMRLGVAIFFSLGVGVCFLGRGSKDHVHSHFGALFMLHITAVLAGVMPMVLTIPYEKDVFQKEAIVGNYHISSYFIAKLLIEIPLVLCTSLITVLVCYWLVEFQGSFIRTVVVYWSMQLCAICWGLLLGSFSTSPMMAMNLTPASLLPQFMFTGFFTPIQFVPRGIRWLQWLCFMKYNVNLALIAEWGYEGTLEAEIILRQNDVEVDKWWRDILVLIALNVAWISIAAIYLSRTL